METKIKRKRMLFGLSVLCMAAVITGTAFSELFPKRVPTRTCGFPNHYKYITRTPSARGAAELTEQEVAVISQFNGTTNQAEDTIDTRFFHRANLVPVVTPAVLTQTDFRFQKSGKWNLWLTAHINPTRGEALSEIQQALGNRENYLHYLNGSRFHVLIHCYARDNSNQNRRTLLASHTIPAFWVKSGEPLTKRVGCEVGNFTQFERNLKQFYDQIDLVEIEFYYEK